MKSYKFSFTKFVLAGVGVFVSAFFLSLSGAISADFTWTQDAILGVGSSAGLYAISVLRAWVANNL